MFLVFNSENDEKRFYDLYTKYNKLLYKYAYDILKNHHDTEDALQDAWFKISKNLHKIENQSEQRTVNFMITVLKNCAINTYNKRNKAEIPYDEGIETPHGHFNGHVSIDTDKDDVKKAIKSIRKEDTRILMLKFTYGYTLKEIAKIFDISENYAGVKISRAKNTIKKFITEMRNKDE